MEQYTIGNHFELYILKSSLIDIGYYRCVERSYANKKYTSQAYFLDILPNYNSKMVNLKINNY